MSSDTTQPANTDHDVRPIVAGKVSSGTMTRTLKHNDPSSGCLYTATEHDMDQALQAAQCSWENFNAMGVVTRCNLIALYLKSLKEKRDHLVSLYALETGCSQEHAQKSVQEAFAMADFQMMQARSLFEHEQNMPGPTGETNALHCSGRGVFISMVHPTASLAAQLGQLIALLASGNAVILSTHFENSHYALLYWLTDMVSLSGAPCLPIHYLPTAASCDALLQSTHEFDGVAFTGPFENAKALSQSLASRPGLLVPLVAETDVTGCAFIGDPHYQLRLIHERTRTINTAAIGGNASLLELGSEA